MLKSFIDVYELGYASGLRRATALPSERNASQEILDSSPDKPTNATTRPAYQEGFVDGFCDGLKALVLRPRSASARPWGQTLRSTVDVLNMVSELQEELRNFFHVLRRRSERREDEAARLRDILVRAETLARDFPAEGTETFLEQRWTYVQFVSLVESARRALAYNGVDA